MKTKPKVHFLINYLGEIFFFLHDSSFSILFLYQNDESKPPPVKEEPDTAEPKQEPMDTEEKKPVVKTEPKEEAESGGSAAAAQSRKKSELSPVVRLLKSAKTVFRVFPPFMSHCTVCQSHCSA